MQFERFQEALVLAAQLHASQKRKGTDIPYVSHLLGVCSLVLEHGGDEDEAIAALLHDAVEDQGGIETLDDIRSRFGNRVADIVEGCSDATSRPKPPWRERKEAYIAHLATADESNLLVSACDKLHNVSSIISDFRQVGDALWQRFKGGRDGTLWYYRELANAFKVRGDRPVFSELDQTVSILEDLVASQSTMGPVLNKGISSD